ncbi:hypothetical protein ACX8Z9_14500 [Arthrobacter halodurans]
MNFLMLLNPARMLLLVLARRSPSLEDFLRGRDGGKKAASRKAQAASKYYGILSQVYEENCYRFAVVGTFVMLGLGGVYLISPAPLRLLATGVFILVCSVLGVSVMCAYECDRRARRINQGEALPTPDFRLDPKFLLGWAWIGILVGTVGGVFLSIIVKLLMGTLG